jgi:uroporphyrinogen decarboxylase
MINRRSFLTGAVSAAILRGAALSPRERVDRVLKSQSPDRSPFTFWYHFGLQKEPPERHAQATLSFHRRLRTDVVKVMSDFPYPQPRGKWYEAEVVANPFPSQIKALELIRDGLGGRAHFIETIFNPWNQATKIASKDEVTRMKTENPQRLLDTLRAIAQSEANHARLAVKAGASGIFLAIDNAQDGILTREEYRKFSEPFDRMVLDAVKDAPLNTLHLHGDKVYLDLFYTGWPAAAANYSSHGTGVTLADFSKRWRGVVMGGLDERNFRKLSPADLKRQWDDARRAVGDSRLIMAPGCSVPDGTPDAELLQVTKLAGA